MPGLKLTKTNIDHHAKPIRRDIRYYDPDIGGFGIKVFRTGRRRSSSSTSTGADDDECRSVDTDTSAWRTQRRTLGDSSGWPPAAMTLWR